MGKGKVKMAWLRLISEKIVIYKDGSLGVVCFAGFGGGGVGNGIPGKRNSKSKEMEE